MFRQLLKRKTALVHAVSLGSCIGGSVNVECYASQLFILLQYSWKLLHPTNEYDNKDCPKDAEAYERVSLIAEANS